MFALLFLWNILALSLHLGLGKKSDCSYAEALAKENLGPYLSRNISFQSLRDQKYRFLIIDPSRKTITVHPNTSPKHSWFQLRDLKKLSKWHSKSPFPAIVLPINEADEPQSAADFLFLQPLLSYCNFNLTTIDILLPKALHMPSNTADYVINESLWLQKRNVGWFRGTMNGGAIKGRFTVVNDSRPYDFMLDLGITDWHPDWTFVGRHLLSENMSMQKAIEQFRYIVVLDGNCDAWRLQELLGKNVVIMKAFPSWEGQWFSSALQPWVHFVPIALRPFRISEQHLKSALSSGSRVRQRSNIVDLMRSLREAPPDRSLQIMRNANDFYRRYLTDEARECYVRRLFHLISKLYTFNVTRAIDRIMKKG